MKLTNEWLIEKNACEEGKQWFSSQKETNTIKVIKKLMKQDRFEWANWLIVRKFTYKQRVQYSVFAAEQVLDIFEKKCPDDKRPRKAIEAARKCIDNPTIENKAAAYAAAAAAVAAYATAAAAAFAAATAFDNAAAAYAADAAYAAAAKKQMRIKIINYGISLFGN